MILNDAINKIVDIGGQMYKRNLISGSAGNLSVRLDNNNILITGANSNLGDLTENDLVVIDLDGKTVSGTKKPSSEYRMHLHIYNQRPEIKACCHAHPPYITAFAVTGNKLPDAILPEIILTIGKIAHTDYAPPGTDAVPESLKPYAAHNNAFILGNHGGLTIGRTLDQAFNRMETVEHYARIIYIARQFGEPIPLTEKEIRRLEMIKSRADEG
jgi:L-fuculose-phosphate aldolase